MQRSSSWPVAVAAAAVGALCCRSAVTTSAPEAGSAQAVLPSVFSEANFCSVDSDCYDVGPYCPLQCHVLVNDGTPLNAEVRFQLDLANERVAEGKCSQSCDAPYNGVTCEERRCRLRQAAPSSSTCWQPDGGAIGCPELLARFHKDNECRSMCDGRMRWDQRRFLVRIGLEDGGHRTEFYVADYIKCSDCR